MLRHVLASSRYVVVIAVLGTFVASLALLLYEMIVVAVVLIDVVRDGTVSPAAAKTLAVKLIEAVDVFLIAIAVYITSLGFYALFVDNRLPLPRWLEIHDLEDLKSNLVSVVIAVLAVLFLREAVAWDGSRDLLSFGVALALVIAALSFFLARQQAPKAAGPEALGASYPEPGAAGDDSPSRAVRRTSSLSMRRPSMSTTSKRQPP